MAKIRVAFLGCGGIAGKHVRSLKGRDDVEMVAGCDVDKEIVERFFARHLDDGASAPPAFADATAMYAETKPQAVVICTPHTLHYEQAAQGLDAGCHVLLEKPMVTSAEHAYAIQEKVEQTGKVFVVAYNTPCTPEFHYLREQIRAGAFGRLELVNGYLSQNWRRLTTGKWRQDPALSGGGQAYDSGAHLLNSLCWSVESRVAEVFALIDRCDTPVDINASITVRFENGVFAAITIGGNCPSDGCQMAFLFDQGRVEIDGWSGSWINVFGADGKRIKYPSITGKPLEPADNFIDAIGGRDEPRTSPANGIVHSELMDAIYESARTGQPAHPRTHHPTI